MTLTLCSSLGVGVAASALITDRRFAGETRGFCSHVVPEAFGDGSCAHVEDVDEIRIVTTNGIDLLLSEEELAQRSVRVKPFTPRYGTVVREKSARLVQRTEMGAITSAWSFLCRRLTCA
jgi:dihydroxyacid dehydratase/phosphogluconate dehydratase